MAKKNCSRFTSLEDNCLQKSVSKGSKGDSEQLQAFVFYLLPFLLLPITLLLLGAVLDWE